MHNWQVVVVSLATQHVCNDIFLSWVIVNFQIVVLDQLEPSLLPLVQVRLSENVLQALVVRIDMSHIPKKIMSPGSQGMNHSG